MAFADAFRAELAAAGVSPGAFETADTDNASSLDGRLAAMLRRARDAHPSLGVADATFAAALARSALQARETGVALDDLAAEDLYLACACAAGVEGAAKALDTRCGARIRAVLAATTKNDDERREVAQRLTHLLLFGDPGDGAPKIAGYGGQGPLDRWVTVVAQRLVVTVIRGEESERRARENAGAEATAGALATVDPEVAFLKEQYRAEFERAMADALAAAGERDRLVLRLHLVSRISVESIGKMHGVSQSTASRWLAEARDAVATEVTRLLRDRIGARASEMRSLAGLVASQLDLSMSRLLGET